MNKHLCMYVYFADGFYLHLNLSHFQRNEKAFLLSPPILDVDKKYCLSFFYLMHGKQVATLSVHALNTSLATEVWATSFEQGPKWLHQEILIEKGRQVNNKRHILKHVFVFLLPCLFKDVHGKVFKLLDT